MQGQHQMPRRNIGLQHRKCPHNCFDKYQFVILVILSCATLRRVYLSCREYPHPADVLLCRQFEFTRGEETQKWTMLTPMNANRFNFGSNNRGCWSVLEGCKTSVHSSGDLFVSKEKRMRKSFLTYHGNANGCHDGYKP